MPKWSSYITRFFLLMGLSVLGITVLFYGLSSYFFNDFYTASNYTSTVKKLAAAGTLLGQYDRGEIDRPTLQQAVNPHLNTDGAFYMLADAQGKTLAYTSSAAPYFAGSAPAEWIASLQGEGAVLLHDPSSGATAMIMGQRLPQGYVFIGQPMQLRSSAAFSFYQRLLISMAMVLLLILFLSTFTAQKVARPARLISDMATRLAEGEQLELPEDLPGQEIREIARALNHMSQTVAQAIQDLRYERDTMSLILEGLTEGILAVDHEGGVLLENAAARQLLGDAASCLRRDLLSAMEKPEDEARQWDGKLQQDGTILYYIISLLPAQNDGRARGSVALIRDITEQERLERTRHDYVANISHELRTPLSSIRGLGEGLRDGMVTEEKDRQRCFSIIVDEATRLSRLVNDLLELSSLQSNPAAFEMEKVDPNELIYELQDRNAWLFTEKSLQFSCVLPENPLPMLISNEDRLAQVLTIFLDNARKYTPQEGSVWIGAEQKENGVRFFVRDTGIGMDAETRRLAFDRFHQAERGRSDKGSGLGLSIAHEILQKMGVDIQVESRKGEGSEFSFIIPLGAISSLALPE